MRAIAKYARITDRSRIEEIYQDSVIYLEKIPRRCTGYTSIFEAILECSQASQWKGEA